jgi:hypothetical protein
MDEKDFNLMTDEELLIEKKKLKKSKIFHAIMIGFLTGVLIFGVTSWLLSEKKRFGFFIPMLIPILFIYKLVKSPNKNIHLETILKERNL